MKGLENISQLVVSKDWKYLYILSNNSKHTSSIRLSKPSPKE